jgi:DNA-binding CsgD family transcriptional regulator
MTLRAGERAHAQGVTREIERRASLNPGFALQAVLARHARGLVEGDAEAMRASVGSLAVVPGPLAKAELLEDASRVLAAVDPAAAVERLEAALEHYLDAGAERDAARGRRGLRELGARRRRRPPARRSSRWGGLTDSELAVVRLVAEGATNRQAAERLYLSPHTVSSHLRHAFEKLNIRSRVELAVLYAERGAGSAG